MEQGLGPYLIISATKPAISLPTSLRPCHMFTKAGMAWPWHEHNVMQLGMSFRICELLNTNHRLWQEGACIKGNQAQCGASKFHKPLQQLLIRQWSKQLQQRHESIVSKAPQPGRRGPLAFQPFCSEFLAGAVPWMGNLVAWQSPGSAVFRPAPLMAQRLPFLSGFPWSPSPPCATDRRLGWHAHDPGTLRPEVLWHGSHQCPQLSCQGAPMVRTGRLNVQGLLSLL